MNQTIENWLFVNENILEFDLGYCSGYYVFDVELIKIKGEWKYRHTLLGAISNCIVDNAIYDTEDETTVEKFLKESTQIKKAIITDLDSKYPQIITKLGVKHLEKTSNKIENAFQKKNNAIINKTNIQDHMMCFKTNLPQGSNLEGNRIKDFENQQSFLKSHPKLLYTISYKISYIHI